MERQRKLEEESAAEEISSEIDNAPAEINNAPAENRESEEDYPDFIG